MELITGHKGEPHVTSHDMRCFNAGALGEGRYILSGGDASATDANIIHVEASDYLIDGAHIKTDGEDVQLGASAGSDYNRIDIICIRYRNISEVETCEFEVVRGEQTQSTPTEPSVDNNISLLEQPTTSLIPIYKVTVTGIAVSNTEKLISNLRTGIIKAKQFMSIRSDNVDAMFKAERTDKERRIDFGIGAGGTNGGIYDRNLNKWILLSDGSNTPSFAGNAKNVTETVAIANGGTGATTAAEARQKLGISPASVGLNDYVVAQGTSGSWYYRKWNSGRAECWLKADGNAIGSWSSWGSLQESKAWGPYNYPFTFISEPIEIGEFEINTAGSFTEPQTVDSTKRTSQTRRYYALRGSGSASGKFSIYIYAVGRWK